MQVTSTRLNRQVLLVAGVPLLLQIVLLLALLALIGKANKDIRAEIESRQLVERCNALYSNVLNIGQALTIYTVTKKQESLNLTGYGANRQSALKALDLLDPVGREPIEVSQLKKVVNEYLSTADQIRENAPMGLPGLLSLRKLQPVLAGIQSAMEKINEKQQLHDDWSAYKQAEKMLTLWIVSFVAMSTLISLLMWVYFNRTTQKRLSTLIDNNMRMASDLPLNPVLVGDDEFAQLDRTFHSMAKELRLANQRRTEMIEMVAHDLRSPLMSIHISMTLISSGRHGDLTDSAKVETQRCAANVDRLVQMINNLLDIEIIASGNMPINKSKIILTDTIDKAVDAVQGNALVKKQTIDYPDEAPSVVADADRIEQVLINFLSNAIKFSPVGSQIKVETALVDSWIEISVTDQGRGFHPQERESMFDRYSQLKSEDKKAGKGLGLSICKLIIDAHGGVIGASSEPGKGSRFWFRLKRNFDNSN